MSDRYEEGEFTEEPAVGEDPNRPGWAQFAPVAVGGQVAVETGRGQAVMVNVGVSFSDTIERIANDANYGGFFRVFLNGHEILNPTEAPPTFQLGQRVTLTPYDKVGNQYCA